MKSNVLIIPGYQGSGAAHWQTWLQSRVPGARRVSGVEWANPDLSVWADKVHASIQHDDRPVWLVAHSFGCLVAAVVAAERPQKIAGVVFVAPADPRRFSAYGGIRRVSQTEQENWQESANDALLPSAAEILPERLPDSIRSVLIASENDPWLSIENANRMAARWRSQVINLGRVGHINTESGFGPWPALLVRLHEWRSQETPDFSLKRGGEYHKEVEHWSSIHFAY